MYNIGDSVLLKNGEVVAIRCGIGTADGLAYLVQGWDDLGGVYESVVKENDIESVVPF